LAEGVVAGKAGICYDLQDIDMFHPIYWVAKEVTYFEIGNRFIHLLCSSRIFLRLRIRRY